MQRIEIKYPDDHPLRTLRGRPQVDSGAKLRALAQRMAWLEYRIADREPEGLPIWWETTELAALYELIDGQLSFSVEQVADDVPKALQDARLRVQEWRGG